MAVAAIGSAYLDRDFFPSTDRNQMIVDVDFPEGTPIRRTTEFVMGLSTELQQQRLGRPHLDRGDRRDDEEDEDEDDDEE